MDSTFGLLLSRLRARVNLTQAEVASRAGTSQPAVARYESTAIPTWSTFQRLLQAMGHRPVIKVEPITDERDVDLARQLLGMEPAARLKMLSRYAGLRRAEQVSL